MEENKPKAASKKKKSKQITVKANKKGKHINPFMNVLRCLAIPAYSLVKPFRFYGEKKVPEGACVFICNHYQLMDPVYPASLTWEEIHYVAKKEVLNNPLMAFFARGVKAITVNRDGNDARGLLDCFKCLKNGEKICIFPEGTRNKTDAEMLPFHSGAAIMAIKCKVPIIPLVIYKKPKFFRCTHVLYGEPIDLSAYYDRKLSEEEFAQVDEMLRQRMIEMKQAHTEYLQAKKKKKA